MAEDDLIQTWQTRAPRCCGALSQNREGCRNPTQQPIHKFCPHHNQEYKTLYKQYKGTEARYRLIIQPERGFEVEQRKEKIRWGRQTLHLGNELNRRFVGEYAKNKGHVKRDLKLEADVNALDRGMKPGIYDKRSFPTFDNIEPSDAGSFDQSVAMSLISPERSMPELAHSPPAHPVKLINRQMRFNVAGLVEKLYTIVPSLDDSVGMVEGSATKASREMNQGDYILRFVFREFLLWKGDVDILALANQTRSIDTFLRSCSSLEICEYVNFFERFGREDTLHFLRDAIGDYLLAPAASCTFILGELVATEDSQRRMPIEGWDILHSYFSDIANWWNIEQFCYRSEDISLVKTLIALGRYRPVKDDGFGWLDKANDVSQECPLATLQGFIGITKEYFDPLLTSVTTSEEVSTERQSRCYLVGRMTKNEPLAKKLIQELINRINRYIIVVYDRESNKVVSRSPEINESLWITRTRSAPKYQDLQKASWEVMSAFKDILSDLTLVRNLRDKNIIGNYYEFIIVDREPGVRFTILDDVASALVQVTAEPPIQHIMGRAARLSIPEDQQRQWLEDNCTKLPPAVFLHIPNVNYEGNRARAWNMGDDAPWLTGSLGKGNPSRSDMLVTTRILADMESQRLITMLKEWQPTLASCYVSPGTDGIEDIYFDYSSTSLENSMLRQRYLVSAEATPLPESLLSFAEGFKSVNPDAVFAKGRLHVHYCAWPMSAAGFNIPEFGTVDGRIFSWNVVPFDIPQSSHVWQYHIHKEMNDRIPFARFVLTTFVVCAKSPEDVEMNLAQLLAAANRHGWKLSVPPAPLWTKDIESLDLGNLWTGIQPASYRQNVGSVEDHSALQVNAAEKGWSCVVQ